MCNQKTQLHNYKVLFQDDRGSMEYCVKCKTRKYFRLGFDGRLTPEFLKEHKRETLQPWDNLYYKEYPDKMQVNQTKYAYL